MNLKKLETVFKKKGIEEFEVYHVEGQMIDVSTFNGTIDANTIANTNEYYVKGVANGHITTVYAEKDSEDEIESLADRILEGTSVIESDEPYIIYPGSEKYLELAEVKHDFDNYTQADLIKICQNIEAYAKTKCPYIKTTNAEIQIENKSVSITNSSKLDVKRNGNTAIVVFEVSVEKDGNTTSGFAYQYVENISDIDQDYLYERAVNRSVMSLGAESIASKQYPVVFENQTACQLMSCFAGMFSADNVIKKLSPIQDKLGQAIFGQNVTIYDDPISSVSPFKYTFDDEGVATKENMVVENGVLKTYLHDLRTAKMMNTEPTGNGYKFGRGAAANLTFKSDDTSFNDLIKDIKEGVLITELMGTHAGVNLTSGSFNLQSSGFMIVDGKIDKPVTLIIVSGNIIDLLNNIEGISNDSYAGNHIVSGSMYVKSLNISGK